MNAGLPCLYCKTAIEKTKRPHAVYCTRICGKRDGRRKKYKNPGSRLHFYNGLTKPLLREIVVEFLGGRCSHCGAVSNLEIDHKERYTLSGKHDIANLQVLCRECHITKSAQEMRKQY